MTPSGRNPSELGGFVFSFIGARAPARHADQMIVTLLREYTRVAGLPFRYIDQISDYQGRFGRTPGASARRSSIRAWSASARLDVDQVYSGTNARPASSR
jgi:hypothetical protein